MYTKTYTCFSYVDGDHMLGECAEHGYFRGDGCPICGRKGKFLMSDRELDSLGRIIAGVLRHFPDKW